MLLSRQRREEGEEAAGQVTDADHLRWQVAQEVQRRSFFVIKRAVGHWVALEADLCAQQHPVRPLFGLPLHSSCRKRDLFDELSPTAARAATHLTESTADLTHPTRATNSIRPTAPDA